MDVRNALKTGISALREADVPSYTLAAELLLLHVLKKDRTWVYAHPEAEIAESDAQSFLALIARRAAGEPTQYLTGKQEFWGLEFEVNPAVLIPRPETEHLIEVALDRLALREISHGRPQTTTGEGLMIADVGTGSGCIAVALARELPLATFYATDISASALEIACRNAEKLGVSDRIHFLESNLLDHLELSTVNSSSPLATRHSPLLLDLVVSNPPYVSRREANTLPRDVRDHEPASALYGGEEGYELYGAIIAQAHDWLKPGGILVLELGYNTLPAVQPLLDPAHWSHVGVTEDLAGIPRVIAAERC